MENISTLQSLSHLPDSCRIWMYQSSSVLNTEQIRYIEQEGKKFCDTWTSHQQPMSAEVRVFYGVVLLIALDESKSGASGCGIDKSVNFVRHMEAYCKNDFFERLRLVFPSEGVDGSLIIGANEVKAYLEKSIITPESMMVNTTVQTLGEFRRNGIISLADSWATRMMS